VPLRTVRCLHGHCAWSSRHPISVMHPSGLGLFLAHGETCRIFTQTLALLPLHGTRKGKKPGLGLTPLQRLQGAELEVEEIWRHVGLGGGTHTSREKRPSTESI